MGRTIVGVILLLLIIALVTANAIYQQYVCDEMIGLLEKMGDEPSHDNAALAKEIRSIWERKHVIFELTMQTHEIDRLSDAIRSLCVAAENESLFDYQISLENTRVALWIIRKDETFLFVNIM